VLYILLMYADPDKTAAMSSAEVAAVKDKHEGLHIELPHYGALRGGAGLALPGETITLRFRATGAPGRTSGPLSRSSSEQLTAYYVIESESEAKVVSFAEQILDDHVTAIEVRRIHDWA
jgi:hypothetical protein